MKPIIIKVSKDKNGIELVSIPLTEFQDAIDNAYEAGIIDGRRQVEEAIRSADAQRGAPIEVFTNEN
jgi:hypothetical protein